MFDGSEVSVMTPTKVGVSLQGDSFEMNSFADRFFWARHQAGIGAPTIAEKTGCAQALISNIEKGAKSSRFNDKFAKLFGVDPDWLRSGEGKVPAGFNATEAEKMRKGGFVRRGAEVISLRDMTSTPRWAGEPDATASDDERAESLQRRIISDYQDYVRLVGAERASAFNEVLVKIGALVAPVKEPIRDDK
jgi:transcriptional regulator with XRE-family HTH domain